MGFFSWLYANSNKRMIVGKEKISYLLIPPAFQSVYKSVYNSAICETCYDGYGHFNGYDVYVLVAEWNKEFLSEEMLKEKPKLENYFGLYDFEKEIMRKEGLSEEEIEAKDLEEKKSNFNRAMKMYNRKIQKMTDFKNGTPEAEMAEKYGKYWKRELGIDIACYDEQNAKLPYPIKITDKLMAYDEVAYSKRDPKQGCW